MMCARRYNRSRRPLDHSRCPTLIVEPGHTRIGTGWAFAEMEKRIPKAERIVYENGGHNVFDYRPDRCVADALAFRRSISPGSAARVLSRKFVTPAKAGVQC